mmetsp:Transcript_23720/g.57583  ORF Transcript_23720/g.57583 Transcript_23720/m.57583 type:complete len:246 (+) Transcript_23720:377-1114(+)
MRRRLYPHRQERHGGDSGAPEVAQSPCDVSGPPPVGAIRRVVRARPHDAVGPRSAAPRPQRRQQGVRAGRLPPQRQHARDPIQERGSLALPLPHPGHPCSPSPRAPGGGAARLAAVLRHHAQQDAPRGRHGGEVRVRVASTLRDHDRGDIPPCPRQRRGGPPAAAALFVHQSPRGGGASHAGGRRCHTGASGPSGARHCYGRFSLLQLCRALRPSRGGDYRRVLASARPRSPTLWGGGQARRAAG